MSENKLANLIFTISYIRLLKILKASGADVSRIKLDTDKDITGQVIGARLRSLLDVILGRGNYRSAKRAGQFVWEVSSTLIDKIMNEAPSDNRSDFSKFVTKHRTITQAMQNHGVSYFWNTPFRVLKVENVCGETIYEFNDTLLEDVQKYKQFTTEVLNTLPSLLTQWNRVLTRRKEMTKSLLQRRYNQIAEHRHSEAYAQSPV